MTDQGSNSQSNYIGLEGQSTLMVVPKITMGNDCIKHRNIFSFTNVSSFLVISLSSSTPVNVVVLCTLIICTNASVFSS